MPDSHLSGGAVVQLSAPKQHPVSPFNFRVLLEVGFKTSPEDEDVTF